MDEQSIVTCKEIAARLNIGISTAKKYSKQTRLFYEKRPKTGITWGQLLKANNLEK
jgi:transposase